MAFGGVGSIHDVVPGGPERLMTGGEAMRRARNPSGVAVTVAHPTDTLAVTVARQVKRVNKQDTSQSAR